MIQKQPLLMSTCIATSHSDSRLLANALLLSVNIDKLIPCFDTEAWFQEALCCFKNATVRFFALVKGHH